MLDKKDVRLITYVKERMNQNSYMATSRSFIQSKDLYSEKFDFELYTELFSTSMLLDGSNFRIAQTSIEAISLSLSRVVNGIRDCIDSLIKKDYIKVFKITKEFGQVEIESATEVSSKEFIMIVLINCKYSLCLKDENNKEKFVKVFTNKNSAYSIMVKNGTVETWLVYLLHKSFLSKKNSNKHWYSQRNMANIIGVNIKTIQKHTTLLEIDGFITKNTGSKNNNKAIKKNVYIVNDKCFSEKEKVLFEKEIQKSKERLKTVSGKGVFKPTKKQLEVINYIVENKLKDITFTELVNGSLHFSKSTANAVLKKKDDILKVAMEMVVLEEKNNKVISLNDFRLGRKKPFELTDDSECVADGDY